VLAATLVVTVMYCEELMGGIPGLEFGDYEASRESVREAVRHGAPCSDILDVASGLAIRVVYIVVLLFAATNKRNKTCCSVLRDVFLTNVSLFLLLLFMPVTTWFLHYDGAA